MRSYYTRGAQALPPAKRNCAVQIRISLCGELANLTFVCWTSNCFLCEQDRRRTIGQSAWTTEARIHASTTHGGASVVGIRLNLRGCLLVQHTMVMLLGGFGYEERINWAAHKHDDETYNYRRTQ